MSAPRSERTLGKSGIHVPALGVGTNRWGGRSTGQASLDDAYVAAVETGTAFFDTAEIYTGGRSERSLREAARKSGAKAMLASKFAPFPYRLAPFQFSRALDNTLRRLGLDSIDLYYLHFPFSPVGITPWMRAMAQAVEAQKIRAVGVSNCSAAQMRRAAAALARYDIVLAANQVHYSATHRQPEKDGVLDTCREMDVALVAYRPVGGGSLRSGATNDSNATLGAHEEVAQRYNATVSQVALAWLLQRDDHVVAIPGSTNADHIRDNARALTLELTDDDVAAIDRVG